MLFKDVLLRNRRVLSWYKVYGYNALLVLFGTSLNSINALLALGRRCIQLKAGEPLTSACILYLLLQISTLILSSCTMQGTFEEDVRYQ